MGQQGCGDMFGLLLGSEVAESGKHTTAASESRECGGARTTRLIVMTHEGTITVSAIDNNRLDTIRSSQTDERGNSLDVFQTEGWEPLRCCLALPSPGDTIALISYTPFDTPSPWSETGPVYIHPTACPGYLTKGELPDSLRTGPKILRTYRADGTLHYDQITLVADGLDLDLPIRRLLAIDEVVTVHVRAVQSQCFAYSVTR